MDEYKDKTEQFGARKKERYIQPSILMALLLEPSYGYELIQNIQKFGFIEGQAPPGMIYRHLKQLEEARLVTSSWETEGTGAAKRMYSITEDGKQALHAWIDYMKEQAHKLEKFIDMYSELKRSD